MDSYEIKNNIVYNEQIVEEYQGYIIDVQNKIEELIRLKRTMNNKHEQFLSQNRERNKSLNFFEWGSIHNKIFGKYKTGMRSLLTSSSFIKANNDFIEAIDKIENKINIKNRDLDEYIDVVEYRQGMVYYWEEELRIKLASEGEC